MTVCWLLTAQATRVSFLLPGEYFMEGNSDNTNTLRCRLSVTMTVEGTGGSQ